MTTEKNAHQDKKQPAAEHGNNPMNKDGHDKKNEHDKKIEMEKKPGGTPNQPTGKTQR